MPMATSRTSKRQTAPKYYRDEQLSRWEGQNHRPRPILVDDAEKAGRGEEGGVVRFVPPNSDLLVELRLRKHATRDQAILEWLARRTIAGTTATERVDVRPFAPFLTFGAFTTFGTQCDGILHLQSVRSAEPGALGEAMNVYFTSGKRGVNPMDVFALLCPGVHLPLGVSEIPHDSRQRNWAYVAVDLSRPIGSQLSNMREYLGDLQSWSYQLADRQVPRPAKREITRDILIFTLRYSQRATIVTIATTVFPREKKESAEVKVKQILRRLRTLIRASNRASSMGGSSKGTA